MLMLSLCVTTRSDFSPCVNHWNWYCGGVGLTSEFLGLFGTLSLCQLCQQLWGLLPSLQYIVCFFSKCQVHPKLGTEASLWGLSLLGSVYTLAGYHIFRTTPDFLWLCRHAWFWPHLQWKGQKSQLQCLLLLDADSSKKIMQKVSIATGVLVHSRSLLSCAFRDQCYLWGHIWLLW